MRTLGNISLILFSLLFFSCEDIFEEDIEDETLVVMAPLEGAVIESNVANFKWKAMEGASKYRIEIYNYNDDKIVDSLVQDKLNLIYPLTPGAYKWKARAENSAYQSKYSGVNNFTIVESLNLTNQVVLLTSPSETYYTNETNLNCIWQDLSAADTYNFELMNITSGQTIIQQSNLTSTSFQLSNSNITSEAKYQWKVKAKNSTSETVFSSRTFFIDRTAPNLPSLSAPANNSVQTADQNITFSWTPGTDNGPMQSPINYTIEVSNTSTFTNIVFTSTVSTNSIQKSFTTTGDYFWRVKATDSARNTSGYGITYKFTIN